jgi:hypothetical protein
MAYTMSVEAFIDTFREFLGLLRNLCMGRLSTKEKAYMRETMSILRSALWSLWVAVASIVTVIFIAREVAWEFRPRVQPNVVKIATDLQTAIDVYSDDAASYDTTFTGDSDLLRIHRGKLGATPELSVNAAGTCEISAPIEQLQNTPDAMDTFVTLCRSASYVKNNRDCSDFQRWLQSFVESNFDEAATPLHRDAHFNAIGDRVNGVVTVTVIP